jgi:hypothetical protein
MIFVVNFFHFVKIIFQIMNILSQILFFLSSYNCLQYESALKILYFHILNITKFG